MKKKVKRAPAPKKKTVAKKPVRTKKQVLDARSQRALEMFNSVDPEYSIEEIGEALGVSKMRASMIVYKARGGKIENVYRDGKVVSRRRITDLPERRITWKTSEREPPAWTYDPAELERVLEARRQAYHDRRDRLLKRGLCADCGQVPHREGVKTCAECGVASTERSAARKQELKRLGLCALCGENPVRKKSPYAKVTARAKAGENLSTCEGCAEKMRQDYNDRVQLTG